MQSLRKKGGGSGEGRGSNLGVKSPRSAMIFSPGRASPFSSLNTASDLPFVSLPNPYPNQFLSCPSVPKACQLFNTPSEPLALRTGASSTFPPRGIPDITVFLLPGPWAAWHVSFSKGSLWGPAVTSHSVVWSQSPGRLCAERKSPLLNKLTASGWSFLVQHVRVSHYVGENSFEIQSDLSQKWKAVTENVCS